MAEEKIVEGTEEDSNLEPTLEEYNKECDEAEGKSNNEEDLNLDDDSGPDDDSEDDDNSEEEDEETNDEDEDDSDDDDDSGDEDDSEEKLKSLEEDVTKLDKRYKDLQSHSDKALAEKDKTIQQLQEKISKNAGTEVLFNSKGEEVRMPTEEEYDDNPGKARTKEREFEALKKEIEIKRSEIEEKNKEDSDNFLKLFNEEKADHWEQAQKLFPEVKDPKSKLFKRATAILKKNPGMNNDPACDLNAVLRASIELGIAPKAQRKKIKKSDTSYIMKGGKKIKRSSKAMSDEEFDNLSSKEQDAQMEKEYLGK